MIARHTVRAITLLIILIAGAADTFAQDIELPAEFLFGRWDQGHYLGLDGTYRDEYQPSYENAYAYTRGAFRVSLDSLGHYLLWSNEDDVTQSAPLSLYWRPSGRTQLGIEDFYWEARDRDIEFSSTDTRQREETRYSAKPQFYLASADSFTVSPEHARYWYLVDEFLMPGQLLSRTSAHFVRDTEHSRRWWYATPGANGYWRTESDYHRFFLSSSFAYGLWRDVAVKARFEVLASWRDRNTRLAEIEPESNTRTYRSRDDRNSSLWWYTMEALTMPLSSVYLAFGVDQRFLSSDDLLIREEVVNDTLITIDTFAHSLPFGVDNSEFFVRTHYITTGEFNPAVLLDDYQGFYGHQLFAGQTQLSTEFRYYRPAHSETRRSSLSCVAKRGISSRLQVGLTVGYDYYGYRSGQRQRRLASRLAVQYRSYDYDSVTGPGWRSDSQYDIAFGVLPEFGQWLVAVKCRAVYGYSGVEPGGSFFDIDDLDLELRFDEWQLTHSLGLGRGIAVNSSHSIVFDGDKVATWHIAHHDYSLGLQVRPVKMVQFLAAFSHYYRYGQRAWRNPIWNLQLQALL